MAPYQYGALMSACTRYVAGGSFAKHKDEMSLTLLCLLEEEGFEGGA